MGAAGVTDPHGVAWTVRRRWYPWRRALSLRDLWASTPSGKAPEPAADEDTQDTQDTELPRNVMLKVAFLVLAAIVWVVYGVGKVCFYAVVVVLFLAGSSIEWVVALAVMPVALLLRSMGLSRWPVEIDRAGEHVVTRHADDFAAAGELRERVLVGIRNGDLPAAG